MKMLFMKLFRQKPLNQIVWLYPSRKNIERSLEHYMNWRFPGASHCHERKGKAWHILSCDRDMKNNIIVVHCSLYDEYSIEIRMHLI